MDAGGAKPPRRRGLPWVRQVRSLARRSLPPRWFRQELKRFWRALVTPPASILDMSGLRRCFADLMAATIVLNLLGLALPLILLQVYDRILPNAAVDTLGALVAGIVVAVTLEMVLRMARSAITAWTAGRFEHMASSRVFRSLLRSPLNSFETSGAGAHLETMNAIGRLRDFYAGQAFVTIFDIPFALLFLGLLAVFGGWLALVPVALLAAMVVVGIVSGHRLRVLLKRRMLFDQSRNNFILEVLSAIQTVKSLAMEAQLQRRHDRLQESSAQAEFHSADLSQKTAALGRLFSSLTTILVVALGSLLVIEGDMSTGVLAACSLLAGRATQPIQLALDRWTRFQAARLAEERLESLLGDDDEAGGKPPLPPVSGEMTLSGLHLRYGTGIEVIAGLDLAIAPGEMIGITGDSGTGKSSLLALMGGLEAPTAGSVRVDGHDLAAHAPGSCRARIGYIAQRTELYRGTILENLSSFDPDRIEAAREVARELGIERFVARLPLGYSTPVASGPQDSLPRGIRQLIAIGRILASRPNIILFDEANTAVDGAGNQALRDMLERLKGKVTIVLVSSRPSLLNLADRSFELADGRLCPAGHESLRPVADNSAAAAAAMMGPMILASLSAEDEGEPASLADADFLRGLKQASPLGRCLVPLLEAMRWCTDPRRLAEAMPHIQSKLDIVSFRNVMANLGFGSSSIAMSGEPVEPRLLPCLFMAADGAPMVLLDAAHDHVSVYDGADGATRKVPHGRLWGVAYFFAAIDAAAGPKPGRWFQTLMERFRGLIWAILAQSLLINVLSLGVPLFTMSVYDKVVGSGDARMLIGILGGVGIVIVAEHVLQELRSRANAYMGVRLSFITSAMVFERTLALPLQMTERVGIAGQLARFRELESFRTLFTEGLAVALLDFPFVFLYVVVLFVLGGPVALVPVVALGAFLLILVGLMPLVRARVADMARTGNQRQEFIVETLTKMRSLHSDGLQDIWEQRFRAYSADAAMAGRHAAALSGGLAALSQAMVIAAGIATMTVAVHQVLAGRMSAGALIAAMMVVWRVLAPMHAGFWLLQRLEQARGTIRQVENLMALKTESEERPLGSTALRLKGAVTFSRVSIRYSSDADPALLGVSFQANPGEVIAVVGPDGAGKSTLLKLIAGLYQPQAGNVVIDDMDIRQLDPVALRKAIAYAPQVPELLFGSIAQNLRLAHPNASEDDLWHALEMAGVRDEVSDLPSGLDTRVGDARNNLIPGALAQGLSLARAYLKRSPIILLDEPVTGLDSEGDRKFREFIEWTRGLATIFLVTHRPSHLSLADQILVLDKGAIRISGPASEVRAKLAG
ncbi:ATP-binding cassette subfamily C [Paramagnetospirillum caucaseum]|uniref:ATP-binding cassette subfamily C n=1 Tax=Paramagnetospirillum caucaseum TaxID=1244869 RepID=M3ADW4_9PROT|nr:ATP-binding cassette domain-containing protein [Paramagnetospirillum caucaseum]EME70699.1 ATP-binding cassette subfamily C [Paramagnetospirillum caucaseum]